MARTETFQETMDRLYLWIRAGHPVIYIASHEEARVADCLARICRAIQRDHPQKRFMRWQQGMELTEIKNLASWDRAEDTKRWLDIKGLPPLETEQVQVHGGNEAEEALRLIRNAAPRPNPPLSDALVVMFDLHPFLVADRGSGISGELVRPLRNAADALRRYYERYRGEPEYKPYKTIVIVGPTAANLSPELERDVRKVDFPLPEREELQRTLEQMVKEVRLKVEWPVSEEETKALGAAQNDEKEYTRRLCELVAGAGRGLTLEDYKLGLNMFSVRQQPLQPRHVEDMLHLKAKAISNQALHYTPHVDIELGGLTLIIDWIRVHRGATISDEVRKKYLLPAPKGVMLCGVSGGGKSQLAKLIAKEFNLALLRLDVGALFGSYVGESEERTRQALQLAEVLAPVVLWLDEVDKAFQGIGDGGDNGVSARVFGHFLTWLAEKEDSVFVVATANDFRTMLARFPEFGRKGRFDQIFWVDLPDEQARVRIFKIYLRDALEAAYLKVGDQDVDAIAQQFHLPGVPATGEPHERFARVLASDLISHNLTGAEIEYAIANAKYRAYERDTEHGVRNGFTPALIAEVVHEAMDQALYRAGGDGEAILEALRNAAHGYGWPFVS